MYIGHTGLNYREAVSGDSRGDPTPRLTRASARGRPGRDPAVPPDPPMFVVTPLSREGPPPHGPLPCEDPSVTADTS
jgi:hypothetical protein